MRARDRTDNVDSKGPRRARWLLVALAGAAAALAYSLVGSLSQLAALTASVTHTTDRRGIVFPDSGAENRLVASPELDSSSEGTAAPGETAPIAAPWPPTGTTAPIEAPAPAVPSTAPVTVYRDDRSFAAELTTLLENDPATLEQVRELLREPDPTILAENLELLRDTFAVD